GTELAANGELTRRHRTDCAQRKRNGRRGRVPAGAVSGRYEAGTSEAACRYDEREACAEKSRMLVSTGPVPRRKDFARDSQAVRRPRGLWERPPGGRATTPS